MPPRWLSAITQCVEQIAVALLVLFRLPLVLVVQLLGLLTL